MIISNRRIICHKFNEYFTNVADKLKKGKYKDFTPLSYTEFFSNPPVVGSIFLTEVDEVEIIDIIKQLDNNKNHIISPVLKGLFNNCLRLGIFPNELKIAKVTPLFKSGNINDMSNYRPISILPVLSKILEKIIYKRLADFFTVKNVLNEAQFGFRQSHSTIQPVQTAVNSIVNTMNTSSYCMGIFIDFSKAFDTIRHDILLHKLKHYGIRGLAYDLISDYLSNRKQFVIYDAKTCSDLLPASIGVPQGSVLGPLFFIIYVNDLFNCGTDSVKFIMFGTTQTSSSLRQVLMNFIVKLIMCSCCSKTTLMQIICI